MKQHVAPAVSHCKLFVSNHNSDLYHLCCFRAESSEPGCISWRERTVSFSLCHNYSAPTLQAITSLEREEMSLYVDRERKVCVTEKQLFSDTNCFLRAFALKVLVMINGNVLGCNLLLAVSNSPSPSGAFFFISVTSWPRRSIASLLVPSYLNVLC